MLTIRIRETNRSSPRRQNQFAEVLRGDEILGELPVQKAEYLMDTAKTSVLRLSLPATSVVMESYKP